MTGSAIPNSAKRSTTSEAGPSVGPQIPTDCAIRKPAEEEEEEEEDDYVPELPPDLAAQRTAQKGRVLGPSLPSAVHNSSYDDSDDDDVGPMPLPAHLGSQQQEKSAVEEFLEREKRRQQAIEVRDVGSLYKFSSLCSARTRRNQRPSNVTSGCWCLRRNQTYLDVCGIAALWPGTHVCVN
jgi:hypothetical protein